LSFRSGIYPAYNFLSKEQLFTIHVDGSAEWFCHLTPVSFNMDYFKNFCFLNQVGGMLPSSWILNKRTLLNSKDGAYQQLPFGPDIAFLVPKDLMILDFPSLTVEERPFVIDNETSCISIPTLDKLVTNGLINELIYSKQQKVLGHIKLRPHHLYKVQSNQQCKIYPNKYIMCPIL
jgi:hypothetical protein